MSSQPPSSDQPDPSGQSDQPGQSGQPGQPGQPSPPIPTPPAPSYGSYGSTPSGPPPPPTPPSPPYGQPAAPTYGQPAAPTYGQPAAPTYGQSPTGAPAGPTPPSQPAWGQPANAWGGPPAGPTGPAGAAYGGSSAKASSFFGKLFDLSFDTFITPSIVRVVYIIAMVVIVIGWLGYAVAAFTQGVLLGLFVLVIVGPIVALLYLVLARIGLEFYLAVIRLAEDVRELKDARASD